MMKNYFIILSCFLIVGCSYNTVDETINDVTDSVNTEDESIAFENEESLNSEGNDIVSPINNDKLSYDSEEFRLSFDHSEDWEVSEDLITVTLTKDEALIKDENSICTLDNPQIKFTKYNQYSNSGSIYNDIPFDANGGLGVFSDPLEDTKIDNKVAVKALFGDACGYEDYFIQIEGNGYYLLQITHNEEGSEEVQEFLESIQFSSN